jgi:hypothetical protein
MYPSYPNVYSQPNFGSVNNPYFIGGLNKVYQNDDDDISSSDDDDNTNQRVGSFVPYIYKV